MYEAIPPSRSGGHEEGPDLEAELQEIESETVADALRKFIDPNRGPRWNLLGNLTSDLSSDQKITFGLVAKRHLGEQAQRNLERSLDLTKGDLDE